MLVITRKLGESITIGAEIVTVVSIGRKKVRLGITAPDNIPIRRAETPVSQITRTKYCFRCRQWVEPSVYDDSLKACDDCTCELSGMDDDPRYGVDDIHDDQPEDVLCD